MMRAEEQPGPPGAEPESYIGFKLCGCVAAVVGLASPDESGRRFAATEIRKWIIAGYRVEPATDEQVRATAWKCIDHKRQAKKAWGKLFAGT